MRLPVIIIGTLLLFTVASGEDNVPEKRLTTAEISAITPTGGGPGSSGLSGIQTRVLNGDPAKAGLYTIQLTVPAETKIKAHTHPDDRVATVISGTWYIGYGSHFDESHFRALNPGRNRSE